MGQSHLQQNDSKQVPKVGNTQPRALGSARPPPPNPQEPFPMQEVGSTPLSIDKWNIPGHKQGRSQLRESQNPALIPGRL